MPEPCLNGRDVDACFDAGGGDAGAQIAMCQPFGTYGSASAF
jgi:hypothetical protein